MSLLFSPFSFSGLKLRNRLVMPPMATAIEGPGGSQVDNGLPGEATLEYYRERAAGGVGMVIVEHTYIDKRGKGTQGVSLDWIMTRPSRRSRVWRIRSGPKER